MDPTGSSSVMLRLCMNVSPSGPTGLVADLLCPPMPAPTKDDPEPGVTAEVRMRAVMPE